MRRATIRSELDEPDVVARAIRPDNTDEMSTRVEQAGGAAADGAPSDAEDDRSTAAVVTEIERETTGGLRTNVDDYVVNVDVATRVVQHAHRHTNTQS